MRAIRNAKPVSVAVGGSLLVLGCVGVWLTVVILHVDQDRPRSAAFTVLFAAAAAVQGVLILSWDRRSKPMVLMRAQPADALPAILPAAVVGAETFSVPEFADSANPYVWFAGLILASMAVSVVPAEKAALSEGPPLRSVGLLDWLRRQDFGAATLLISIFFTAAHVSSLPRFDVVTMLIVGLALAQATVSVWRIIEHNQVSKAGIRLPQMRISWLRAIHVSRGHEAAAKELRAMYPKVSSMQADSIIENLHRAEEGPLGISSK
jgi:hypothetical protein